MPISHLHKTIFVHIPKTAESSIEAVLGMHGTKTDVGIAPYFNQVPDRDRLFGGSLTHMTAVQIRRALDDERIFADYFKFTFVRNPWDRLISGLAWMDQKWAKAVEVTHVEVDAHVRSLHVAVRASGSSRLAQPPQFLLPQHRYVVDEQGHNLVDFVGRYEDLQADWQRICERLKVVIELPLRMRSLHKDYRSYFSPETRDMVAEIYAEDIDAFGYYF